MRHLDAKVCHGLYHPFEVMGRQAVNIHVRRRVHKVDRVGNAVFDRKLDTVHVVAHRAIDQARIMDHTLANLRCHIGVVNQILALAWVVADRHNVFLPDTDATYKLIPLDKLLQHHAERAGFVVGADQFVHRVHFIDVFPATAPRILENGGQTHILDNCLPIEWVDEVAQTFADYARNVLFGGQHQCPWRSQPHRRDQAGAEKLIIGAPPKGVVDNVCALQHGIFQIGPVIRHFVADAVDQHRIVARRVHAGAAQFGIFRHHTGVAPVYLFDKGRWKTPFASNNEANLFDITHSSPFCDLRFTIFDLRSYWWTKFFRNYSAGCPSVPPCLNRYVFS